MPMSGGVSPAPSALCPHNTLSCTLDSNIGATRGMHLSTNHPQRLRNPDYSIFTLFAQAKHILEAGSSLQLTAFFESKTARERHLDNPG